jgi:DNA-binding transcriptional LysR family regulator
VAEVSSIGLIKSLAIRGAGVGLLTAFDAISEIQAGSLIFVPLSDERIDLSTLSIVSASGRTLSVPASLLIQHLAQIMDQQGVPVI